MITGPPTDLPSLAVVDNPFGQGDLAVIVRTVWLLLLDLGELSSFHLDDTVNILYDVSDVERRTRSMKEVGIREQREVRSVE